MNSDSIASLQFCVDNLIMWLFAKEMDDHIMAREFERMFELTVRRLI